MRAQFVIPVLASIILIGTIATGIVVFADEPPKTLAEECAKKLDKNNLNLDGLFCLAIQSLNSGLFVQTDDTKPVLFLQVDPDSQAPALVVNNGTHDVFTVNKDGSIQIGSNTVIINPDGTVTGNPLFLLAGSTVDGNLIVAPAPPCNNKDLAQLKGGSWKCTKPEDIGAGDFPNQSTISFETTGVVTIATANTLDPTNGFNPLILYQVSINKNGLPNRETPIFHAVLLGQGETISGTNVCQVGWIHSIDNGVTWRQDTKDQIPDSFVVGGGTVFGLSNFDTFNRDSTDFAFAGWNVDGATSCTFQDMITHIQIFEVKGYTYTRVI